MKVTVLISFCFVLYAAGNSYSQTTKMTLSLKNMTVKEVLNQVEDKSDFIFLYKIEELDENKRVNVELVNASIQEILDEVLKEQNLTYDIYDRQVIIRKVDNNKSSGATTSVQNETITGKVTDSSGTPLPGVSVVIKGTTQGIITDTDGKYSLANVPADATLVFSFVGMKTQEIPVAGKTTINVIMEEETVGIEEVVAIGYGTIRKSDLTGSVAKIKVENTSERAVTSMQQLLQGQISGVQITQNTGAAGGGISFVIRGANSITSSGQPLIIIDGYPVESSNSAAKVSAGSYSNYISTLPSDNTLSTLNPSDIESVEILKDASATAIYGSRAANGVVLITTKRGKLGETKISGSLRYDISTLPRKIDVLNTEDYIKYTNEAYTNSGEPPYFSDANIEEYMKTDTDWQELIYRASGSSDYRFNISGGNEKLRYAVLLGYLNQEGIVENNNFDRGSIRVNLDANLSKRFKIGLNMSGTKSLNEAVMQSTNRSITSGSVVTAALRTYPLQKPYDTDDEIDVTFEGNPLLMVTKAKDHNWVTTVMANMFLEYDMGKGFNVRINGGANIYDNQRKFYHPRGTLLGNLNNGLAYNGYGNSFNYLTEYTLNYNRVFNEKHRINAVAGYTWQEWKRNAFGITTQNFPNDVLTYYDLSSASAINKPSTSTSEWALASYIGRANYSFDNRYLVTFTGRYDGSTRLGEGNKWDFFSSVALGWNIHNEKFMKQAEWLSELKLRGSYGTSGNQSIGVGSTKAKLSTGSAVINESIGTIYSLANLPNEKLKWEVTKQIDLGLNAGFLNDRITLEFDYYKKRTENLLISLSLPLSTGFSSYNTNQGCIENTGFEFGLSAKILTREFKWSLMGNISINKNKIIDLGDAGTIYGSTFPAIGTQYLHIAQVGSPIGAFYGYRIIGIYQNQTEITEGPTDAANPQPGSFKYKDISGVDGTPDGTINAYDREIIGNPYPDFTFGLTNNWSWKNFNLSVLIEGSIGQDVINGNRYYMDALCRGFSGNVRQEVWDNRWTGEGTSNFYPKATTSNTPFYNRFADFIVEDGSYVRLRNVTLSYSFNHVLKTKSVSLFVSAANMITITKYKGYDPEINSQGDDPMTPGVDYGSIPQYRTVSFGVNIDF